jgi:hypothetical protein
MRASLLVTYPLHSLLCGGSPVRLALLCVAVGVLVMVTIQSVGHMATIAYVNNVRVANGGDVSLGVGDPSNPIKQSDLSFLAQLKRVHAIDNYTPVNLENGAIGTTPAPFSGLLVQIVDPQQVPLVAPPTFISPPSGSLKTLLTGNQVVVTQTFLEHYQKCCYSFEREWRGAVGLLSKGRSCKSRTGSRFYQQHCAWRCFCNDTGW